MPDRGLDQEVRRKKAMVVWMETAFKQSIDHANIAVALEKDHPHLAMLAESAATMLKVFANALRTYLD